MKTIILSFAILLIPAFLLSQSHENFKVEEKNVIWQKVFETELSFEDVTNSLIVSGIYDDYEIYGSQLIGQLKQFDPKYEEAGYSNATAPMVMSGNNIDAFSVLEYKEGRYRITLKKIILTKLYDDPFSSLGEKTNMEDLALNNRGEFRKGFLKHAVIYETTFDQLFTISTELAEDW